MGFLDMFRKKKEIQAVKFNELDSWLQGYFEKVGLADSIKEFRQKFDEKRKELFTALELLQNAELMNKNIPARALHIMEGNRNNYLRQMRGFFEKIELPQDYSEFMGFSEEFPQRLDELSKQTQKNYFVLKEFLSHEAYEIVKIVKELETSIIRLLRGFEKQNLGQVNFIRGRLEDFRKAEHMIKELKTARKKEEARLSEFQAKHLKIQKRLSEYKQSKRYDEFRALSRKEDALSEKMRLEKKEFLALFLEMEKALKKYKRQSLDEKLIEQYLEDAASALVQDADLGIIQALQKMKASLGGLNLKDRQAAKIQDVIEKLDKKFLEETRKNLMALELEIKKARAEKLNNTVCLNIEEQESLLKSNLHNIAFSKKQIEELDHKLERLNLNLIRQEIAQKLRELGAELEK